MRLVARSGSVALIIVGAVAMIVALITVGWIGRDNTISLRPATISTETAAVSTGAGLLSVHHADLVVQVRSVDPKARLWIGTGYQDDLKSFLGETSRAEVASYRYPGSLQVREHRDENESLPEPGELDWWLASDSGTGDTGLSWQLPNAPCGLVIMNADGSRGLEAEVTLALRIDGVSETAAVVGGAGLLTMLLGIGGLLLTRHGRIGGIGRPGPSDAGDSPEEAA